MLDPWKHLDRWAKPANVNQAQFDKIYDEAMSRTDFAAERHTVLRGQTVEVIENIPDNSLDFIYIDADQSLKGISIDMIRAYPKLKAGGMVGGDDSRRQSGSMRIGSSRPWVCPFAAYFAEAVGAPLVIFPRESICDRQASRLRNKFPHHRYDETLRRADHSTPSRTAGMGLSKQARARPQPAIFAGND